MSRVDEWTGREDKILAETVLNYVRNGKTQTQAFEDICEQLDRSAAACAFRWNSTVRKSHEEDLRVARREWRREIVTTQNNVISIVQPKKETRVEGLQVKEYREQRVVTFKDIDEVHERPEGTASRNFQLHKGRFIESEDYFVIKSQNNEIRGLENIPNRGLTVLTESGYLMLVKSFTDDLAWKVQRSLVKNYFRVKKTEEAGKLPTTFAEALRLAADLEEQKQKLEAKNLMLEQTVAEYQPKMTYLDIILESKDSVLVSQIAEDYGLSAVALNKILNEEKIQYKMNDQWLLYSIHKGRGYTESKTHTFAKSNGEKGTRIHTRWTQKGRLFIHNILTNKGILPLMDRETNKADAPTSDQKEKLSY